MSWNDPPKWRKRLRLRYSASFLILCWALSLAAQSAASNADAMHNYGINCFCSIPGPSPEEIIRMDNNSAILLAARNGTTRAQLTKARIPYTESQLRLLADWNLLKEHGDSLTTAIPILDEDETKALRMEVRAAARAALPEIQPELGAFLQALRRMHREGAAFTILFSYTLDNLVWHEFTQEKLLAPGSDIDAAHPFWVGEAWATEPAPAFRTGTNSDSNGPWSVNVNWSDSVLSKLGPFQDFKVLSGLLSEMQANGKIVDPGLRKALAAYAITDDQGEVTIPIIMERAGDPLYQTSVHLAARIAQAFTNHLSQQQIQARCGLRNRQLSVVISYHEFMYALLDLLDAEHIVEKPVAFVSPERARPSDVGNLVFLVHRTK